MTDLNVNALDAEAPSNEVVVSRANHLLAEFNIPTQIEDVSDISAALFVVLYESLFSEKLPGIIRKPTCKDDEIHNCQIVIDVLSADVIHDSLSHIRAVDIIAGDITAIFNLLDIFAYLLEYVVNKIESDVPTDIDDTRSLASTQADSEISTPASFQRVDKKTVGKKESRIPTRKGSGPLRNRAAVGGRKQKPKTDRKAPGSSLGNAGLNTNENRKVISHEEYYAMVQGGGTENADDRKKDQGLLSPIKPDQSQSLLGQKTVDSADLDGSFETIERKLELELLAEERKSPKLAWEDRGTEKVSDEERLEMKSRKDAVPTTKVTASGSTSQTVTSSATATQNGNKPLSSYDLEAVLGVTAQESTRPVPTFSASLPNPSHFPTRKEDHDRFRSTVGPIDYHAPLTPDSAVDRVYQSNLVKGMSSSYDDLKQMVERTAVLTRLALETSPVHKRAGQDLDITDLERDRPCCSIPSDSVRLAKELNALGLDKREEQNVNGKRVAFATNADHRHDRSDSHRWPLGHMSDNELRSERPGYKKEARGWPALDTDSDFDSWEAEIRQRLLLDRGKPRHDQEMVSSPKQKAVPRKGTKTEAMVKHLARNRQPELGAAHMTLKTSDQALKKKQDILRKLYEEDFEDFAEDVQNLLEKDQMTSKEIEEKLLRTYAESAAAKTVAGKGKAVGKVSTCKKPRVTRAAGARIKNQPQKPAAPTLPLRLESEEDLLPVLLKEFPHLHMSEHTWHELKRRGLRQIESLTQAYQESKRKKSRAQSQMEDAANRHDLLSEIMRKQLDHSKRLRDIKEQKALHVQLRNKAHEKRIQSARARRYYNEYQVRARSKQLKRRTKEEIVFRELFKDALEIQKERIKDIRQYASDQRKRQETRRQNEIESMENFYNDQFEMLAERLTQERLEASVRDSAQKKMLDRMKQELRKKMESEIKQYQDEMFRDNDDAHFRQVDADKVKRQLHMARYGAKI